VRREIKARGEIKYSLSNAPSTTAARPAQMQGQRDRVERAFQDGKSQTGLRHDQARARCAWHPHMALPMMAMLFMLEEWLAARDTYPLLGCADVETLLAQVLRHRDCALDDVIRQLEIPHRKCRASIGLCKTMP
jgi:hypothetical protein